VTKRDRKALGRYLRFLANAMGLRDWELILEHDPVPEGAGALATCRTTFGQRRATIAFAADARDWNLDRLRRVCVHELMHCHLDRMDTAREAAADELGAQARRVSDEAWRSALEDACDDIATAWADQFPMIEWPEPATRG